MKFIGVCAILEKKLGGASMAYIGCHLSTTGGYAATVKTALSIGADTFAFFTRNPRGSKAKAVDWV